MDTWHILCQWKKCLLSRGHNRKSVLTHSSWRECVTKHSVSCIACLLSAVTSSAVPSPWMFALMDICVNVIIFNKTLRVSYQLSVIIWDVQDCTYFIGWLDRISKPQLLFNLQIYRPCDCYKPDWFKEGVKVEKKRILRGVGGLIRPEIQRKIVPFVGGVSDLRCLFKDTFFFYFDAFP